MNEIGKISCCKDQLIHIQNKYLGADQRFFLKGFLLIFPQVKRIFAIPLVAIKSHNLHIVSRNEGGI